MGEKMDPIILMKGDCSFQNNQFHHFPWQCIALTHKHQYNDNIDSTLAKNMEAGYDIWIHIDMN
jgi:hypothetical protein